MAVVTDPRIPVAFRLLLRIPVPLVYILTYLVGVLFETALPTHALRTMGPNAALAIGGLVFVAGAAIAGWGLITFRNARTTTIPGRASAQFVTWGPYRYSRNPMYVGLAIAYLGEAIHPASTVAGVSSPVDVGLRELGGHSARAAETDRGVWRGVLPLPTAGATVAVEGREAARQGTCATYR